SGCLVAALADAAASAKVAIEASRRVVRRTICSLRVAGRANMDPMPALALRSSRAPRSVVAFLRSRAPVLIGARRARRPPRVRSGRQRRTAPFASSGGLLEPFVCPPCGFGDDLFFVGGQDLDCGAGVLISRGAEGVEGALADAMVAGALERGSR